MDETPAAPKPPVRVAGRRAGAPAGPRRADARRAALVEAAGRLFVEKGLQATTMDEIAAAANVAKGTLYHYFASKADLLAALRDDFTGGVMKRIRARVEACPVDDWKARLRAWLDTAVEAYLSMRGLHDVIFFGDRMPRRYAMADADITRSLAEIIGGGVEAGVWRAEDVRWTAVIMFYSFRGGCDEAIMGTHDVPDVSGRLHELFLHMLRAAD